MKSFLIYILSVIPFFAPAQVVLPDSVASFYLNRHFYADNLENKNKLLTQLVDIQNKTLESKDLLINNLGEDYKTHTSLIDNFKKTEIEYKGQIGDLNKQVKIEKTKSTVCIIAFVLLALL